jgi:hypothetical protein
VNALAFGKHRAQSGKDPGASHHAHLGSLNGNLVYVDESAVAVGLLQNDASHGQATLIKLALHDASADRGGVTKV